MNTCPASDKFMAIKGLKLCVIHIICVLLNEQALAEMVVTHCQPDVLMKIIS